MVIDEAKVDDACVRQHARRTEGIRDIDAYLARQVHDESHRDVIGPLLPGSSSSGVVLHRGTTVGTWGDPHVPEMTFSVTKTVVGLVAGIGYDLGLLDVDAPVAETVSLPQLQHGWGPEIRWRHLLQQTSQWDGELWGKPATVDAQSRREGDEPDGGPPGSGWAYNDVRVNLLCLALTALFRRPLPDVLTDVLRPLDVSTSWSWHGYHNSHLTIDGRRLPVVSGGAHWGGGLWMSAHDLALIGQLYLRSGASAGRRVISSEWIRRSWQPCPVKPEYGYLWWLNERATIFPLAPTTGRCARGNLGRHLLWIDPARDLVIASHWGEDIGRLLADISDAITP